MINIGSEGDDLESEASIKVPDNYYDKKITMQQLAEMWQSCSKVFALNPFYKF